MKPGAVTHTRSPCYSGDWGGVAFKAKTLNSAWQHRETMSKTNSSGLDASAGQGTCHQAWPPEPGPPHGEGEHPLLKHVFWSPTSALAQTNKQNSEYLDVVAHTWNLSIRKIKAGEGDLDVRGQLGLRDFQGSLCYTVRPCFKTQITDKPEMILKSI